MNRLYIRSRAYVIAMLIVLSLFAFVEVAGKPSFAQSQNEAKGFPLLKWDGGSSCRAKGRLQDRQYCHSAIMDEIVTQGKDAVPILISQLTDTRELKEPIFDFWGRMTVGDVANSILDSLFTDSDWKTFNMPGLEQIRPTCRDSSSYACWQMVLKQHGRRFIQDDWLMAWNRNKDHVYWDKKARCFRLDSRPGS
jgi:hypothetical protein